MIPISRMPPIMMIVWWQWVWEEECIQCGVSWEIETVLLRCPVMIILELYVGPFDYDDDVTYGYRVTRKSPMNRAGTVVAH